MSKGILDGRGNERCSNIGEPEHGEESCLVVLTEDFVDEVDELASRRLEVLVESIYEFLNIDELRGGEEKTVDVGFESQGTYLGVIKEVRIKSEELRARRTESAAAVLAGAAISARPGADEVTREGRTP